MFLPRINLVIGYWVRISTSPLIALSIQFRLFWIICSQKVDTEIFDFRENKKIILTNDRKLRSRINYARILIWDQFEFFYQYNNTACKTAISLRINIGNPRSGRSDLVRGFLGLRSQLMRPWIGPGENVGRNRTGRTVNSWRFGETVGLLQWETIKPIS